VNYLPQILDSLPPPYTQAGDSVLASIVNLSLFDLATPFPHVHGVGDAAF